MGRHSQVFESYDDAGQEYRQSFTIAFKNRGKFDTLGMAENSMEIIGCVLRFCHEREELVLFTMSHNSLENFLSSRMIIFSDYYFVTFHIW